MGCDVCGLWGCDVCRWRGCDVCRWYDCDVCRQCGCDVCRQRRHEIVTLRTILLNVGPETVATQVVPTNVSQEIVVSLRTPSSGPPPTSGPPPNKVPRTAEAVATDKPAGATTWNEAVIKLMLRKAREKSLRDVLLHCDADVLAEVGDDLKRAGHSCV